MKTNEFTNKLENLKETFNPFGDYNVAAVKSLFSKMSARDIAERDKFIRLFRAGLEDNLKTAIKSGLVDPSSSGTSSPNTGVPPGEEPPGMGTSDAESPQSPPSAPSTQLPQNLPPAPNIEPTPQSQVEPTDKPFSGGITTTTGRPIAPPPDEVEPPAPPPAEPETTAAQPQATAAQPQSAPATTAAQPQQRPLPKPTTAPGFNKPMPGPSGTSGSLAQPGATQQQVNRPTTIPIGPVTSTKQSVTGNIPVQTARQIPTQSLQPRPPRNTPQTPAKSFRLPKGQPGRLKENKYSDLNKILEAIINLDANLTEQTGRSITQHVKKWFMKNMRFSTLEPEVENQLTSLAYDIEASYPKIGAPVKKLALFAWAVLKSEDAVSDLMQPAKQGQEPAPKQEPEQEPEQEPDQKTSGEEQPDKSETEPSQDSSGPSQKMSVKQIKLMTQQLSSKQKKALLSFIKKELLARQSKNVPKSNP